MSYLYSSYYRPSIYSSYRYLPPYPDPTPTTPPTSTLWTLEPHLEDLVWPPISLSPPSPHRTHLGDLELKPTSPYPE